VNLSIPAPKIEALQVSPKRQNDDFLENVSNNYDYISIIYGDHLLPK
jgi:hypothetical protein